MKFGHLTVTQNQQPTLFESAHFSTTESPQCLGKKRKEKEFGGRRCLLRDLKGLISASALDLQFSSTLRSPLSFPILCSTPDPGPVQVGSLHSEIGEGEGGQIDSELEEIISHSWPRTQPSAALPSRNAPAKKITTHSPANPRRGERERGREN